MKSESITFILIILRICTCGHHDIGSSCIVKFTESDGTCKLLQECPLVMENVKHHEFSYTKCIPIAKNKMEIVCCPEMITTSIEKPSVTNYFSTKSDRMCYEYKSTIIEDGIASSLEEPSSRLKLDKCENKSVPLIPNSSTSRKEYPHIAFLGYATRNGKIMWLCSGILISYEWVLAPAHCSYSKYGEPRRIRLGELHNNIEDYSYRDNYLIAKTVTHPEYNISSAYNNIVLYQLLPKVKLSKYKRPACLPSTIFDSVESKAILTRLHQDSESGKNTPHLRQSTVKILSTKDCNDLYVNHVNSQLLEQGIMSETQICATSVETETCSKNSDGILQVYHPEQKCMHIVIGIASFGKLQHIEDCKIPDVYTRIFPYVDWIESVIWKNEDLMYITDIRR